MESKTTTRRPRKSADPVVLVQKKETPLKEEVIGESPIPLPTSSVVKSPTKRTINKSNSEPRTPVKRVKEEVDPGELVSAWHQMNKKYQNALDTLSKVADQLDELSKELETKFGIKVPNAKRLNTTSNSPVTPTQAQATYEDYDTEPYQEGNWSPPVQTVVNTSTVNNPNFIEQMRKDASIDSSNSDQSFAASIAAQFNNIMGSLK